MKISISTQLRYFFLTTLMSAGVATSLPGNSFANLGIVPRYLNTLPALKAALQVKVTPQTIPSLSDEPSYNIRFSPNLFASKKYSNVAPGRIGIVDTDSNQTVAEIWLCSNHVSVEIKGEQSFAFEGLNGVAQRKFIRVTGGKKVSILDEISADKIEIDIKNIHFVETPIIRNKILLIFSESCLFEKPFNYPFQSTLNNGRIRQESFIKIPSAKIDWAAIPKISTAIIGNETDVDFLLSILEKSMGGLWKEERLAAMQGKTLTEKNQYLQRYVLKTLKDNAVKGELGEAFVKRHLLSLGYAYHMTQNNRNQGLDGFYLRGANDGLLVEVKYSSTGKPKPNLENINGWGWRQLSRPYIEEKLKNLKLAATQEGSQELANSLALIQAKEATTALGFFVFNVANMTLDSYQVGNRQVSRLD